MDHTTSNSYGTEFFVSSSWTAHNQSNTFLRQLFLTVWSPLPKVPDVVLGSVLRGYPPCHRKCRTSSYFKKHPFTGGFRVCAYAGVHAPVIDTFLGADGPDAEPEVVTTPELEDVPELEDGFADADVLETELAEATFAICFFASLPSPSSIASSQNSAFPQCVKMES